MLKLYSLLILCLVGGCFGQKTFVVFNKDTLPNAVQNGNLILIFTSDLDYFERFFSYIKELADVSVTQGNKDLIFGTVDCKEDNALCQQYGVTQDLELKQFDIRSPNLELVLKYIKDLLDEFLREEVTKNFILKNSGKAFVFYKIKKCKFCNQIFKYWPTVVDHFKDSDVHIGTIDCHHYRDLCDICDVTGYPRLHMVIDGKCGERQTGGERDANTIINFIDDQVEKNS